MLVQAFHYGFRIGELSCPTRYFPEASSINFRRSVTYGLAVTQASLAYRLQHLGFGSPAFLQDSPESRLCCHPPRGWLAERTPLLTPPASPVS